MSRIVAVALAAAFVGFAGSANAQRPAAPVATLGRDFANTVIKTTDLGHNTYMLAGEGGNMTIAVGDDGIIMVDCRIRAAARQDQGGHRSHQQAADQISRQYALPWRSHRRQRGVPQGRRHRRRQRQCAQSPRGRHDQRPDRREDTADGGRRIADADLSGSDHAQGQGTHGAAWTSEECPHRRRHLRAVPRRRCARNRRHLHQRPLSEYRLRQWRQHQRHDRGRQYLSQARGCQDQDRARPRSRSPPRRTLSRTAPC